jgi:hypothetical protein
MVCVLVFGGASNACVNSAVYPLKQVFLRQLLSNCQSTTMNGSMRRRCWCICPVDHTVLAACEPDCAACVAAQKQQCHENLAQAISTACVFRHCTHLSWYCAC